MRHYIDQEFQEGFYKPLFGKKRHFIDLISIAIVAEDGREYYAVSNEFDLKSVWQDQWLRENVLEPIHADLCSKQNDFSKTYFSTLFAPFTVKSLKNLLKWYGKSNKQIAEEIKDFVQQDVIQQYQTLKYSPIDFYGYYSAYDHVLFCSLFGKMIDLPDGFPMYTRDLKQTLDEISESIEQDYSLKEDSDYPIQEGEHNALEDARWNKQLHEFLLKKQWQLSKV